MDKIYKFIGVILAISFLYLIMSIEYKYGNLRFHFMEGFILTFCHKVLLIPNTIIHTFIYIYLFGTIFISFKKRDFLGNIIKWTFEKTINLFKNIIKWF